MKKIAIVGKNKRSVNYYKRKLKDYGFIYSKTKPDMGVSLGGDGTYLFSEMLYPGIPKLLIRDSNICNKCDWDSLEEVLRYVKNGKYVVEEYFKLRAVIRKKSHKLLCVNDFVIRNKLPLYALRFELWLNKKKVGHEMIGDGIVVSTPFGSTGYYHSISKKSFDKGIGVAFNNLTEKRKHLVVNENSVIKLRITRNEAVLCADNNPRIFHLKEGEMVTISKSREKARIVKIRG